MTCSSGYRTNFKPPSPWVSRFIPLVPKFKNSKILDVACGNGRHTALSLSIGHHVLAVDRDTSRIVIPHRTSRLTIVNADLETKEGWPFHGMLFEGVIVTNYLYRPILADIVSAVAPGGMLIYETFALGNEDFGHPENPEFLLQPGELLKVVEDQLTVLAYENRYSQKPAPSMIQHIAAIRLNNNEKVPIFR